MPTLLRLQCTITDELELIRELVRVYAAHAGLLGERLDHLVLAVHEAAANVIEHGGGRGELSAYTSTTIITVEICDSAGLLRPEHLTAAGLSAPPASGKRAGLWLIQRLCDEVSLDHPRGSSRLRLRMRLPPSARPQPRTGADFSPGDSRADPTWENRLSS